MPSRSTSFRIEGIEPANDPLWLMTGETVHREFWRAVVVYGIKAKEEELAEGLDRYGRKLTPIAATTRKYRESEMGPADPSAPPLMPAYATSRTRLNLSGRALKNSAEFFWTDGWGKILAIHRAGSRRGLPKRDVIGISPKSLQKVKTWAAAWWARKRAELHRTVAPRPTHRPVSLPATPFKPLPVLGRTDFERFTYGIGTTGGNQAVISRQLLAQGRSTGFFQRRPGQGLAAIGGPSGPRLAPVAEQLTFKPAPDLRGYTTVEVDIAKVEASFTRDTGYHVGVIGVGGAPGRYAEFGRFVQKALDQGIPIEQPIIHLDRAGDVTFRNGRHRWAWLRDQGLTSVPVSIARSLAARLRRLYGAS